VFVIAAYLSWPRVAVAAVIAAELVTFGVIAVRGAGTSVDGIIVGSRSVAIDIAPQTSAWDAFVVKRIVTPIPSWVVVQVREGVNGTPGRILGRRLVPAGTSRDVRFSLDSSKGLVNTFLVTLMADAGKPGVFEYRAPVGGSSGMMGAAPAPSAAPSASVAATATPDKPLVAAGAYVSVAVDETVWNGGPEDVHRVPEP
jgi:hypothetical protein